MGGMGKKEKRTHAARAFGKNGLGHCGNIKAIDRVDKSGLEHRGNIKAIDWDTAEL